MCGKSVVISEQQSAGWSSRVLRLFSALRRACERGLVGLGADERVGDKGSCLVTSLVFGRIKEPSCDADNTSEVGASASLVTLRSVHALAFMALGLVVVGNMLRTLCIALLDHFLQGCDNTQGRGLPCSCQLSATAGFPGFV